MISSIKSYLANNNLVFIFMLIIKLISSWENKKKMLEAKAQTGTNSFEFFANILFIHEVILERKKKKKGNK